MTLELNWPEGLSSEQFLSEYWQKKPLLFRNALPDFENPLTPDELAGLALDEDINSRLILQSSATKWHVQPGPFSEEELTSLPAAGWSLLVSDIEKHLHGFYQYLAPFRFIPDWQIDDLMISYAPKTASVGAHIDEYDVFLLQASGQRHWSIDNTEQPDTTLIPDLEIKVLKNFQANQSWTLGPRDMLYLPPGVPHHGVSCDNDCMTWSIGFRAISHADLLQGVAQRLALELPDCARYRDANQQLQQHCAEISEHTLTALHSLWLELTQIDAHVFNKLIGNILTERHVLFPADDSQQNEKLNDLMAHTHVTRNAASRLVYVTLPSCVQLHADGAQYPVSKALALLLTTQHHLATTDLMKFADSAQDQACLEALWQRGILYGDEQ